MDKINAQDMNQYFAERRKNPKKEIKDAEKNGNDFLMGYPKAKEKPDWLDSFLESNNNKMKETIGRIVSSEEGIGSLAGYGEGYFNEIVQNANDLHQGEELSVSVGRDGEQYYVDCTYADKGFDLSNIYSFLNREMSNKDAQNGQTGKFGIGIKSLLMFVDEFDVRSNVHFRYKLDRENTRLEEGFTKLSDLEREEKTTVLSIRFHDSDKSGRINGFNVGKLENLIDSLCIDSEEDLSAPKLDGFMRYFLTGKDEELVLDIRALLFLDQKKGEQCLKCIRFQGTKYGIQFQLKTTEEFHLKNENTDWRFWKSKISAQVENVEEVDSAESIRYYEYLCCSSKGFIFAFPLEDELSGRNRFYSTYYLREDGNADEAKFVPISALIHSKYSNMHRTSLGEDEKSREEAYKVIGDKLRELFASFCDCGWESNTELSVAASDIFHSVLERYFETEEKEPDKNRAESPFSLENLTTRYLPKLKSGEREPFVVWYEEEEPFKKVTPKERQKDSQIREKLEKVYREDIERGETYDYDEEISSDEAIPGVRRLYKMLADRWNNYSSEACNLSIREKNLRSIVGFFPEIKELIAFRIKGQRDDGNSSGSENGHYNCMTVSDAEVDRWLLEVCKEETGEERKLHENLLLKLVGRYELNNAIDRNGEIQSEHLNFWDYIFNDTLRDEGAPLSKRQTEQFQEKYGELKEALLARRLCEYYSGGHDILKYHVVIQGADGMECVMFMVCHFLFGHMKKILYHSHYFF